MRLYGLNELINSENETEMITAFRLKGVFEFLPRANDILLKLPYFFGDLEDVSSDRGQFQSIATITYMQLPYTLRSLYILYEKGYYLEGLIVYRHLIESFIMLKYFNVYPEKLSAHISQKKRVTFSAMFNQFSVGFYDQFYSKQYSEAAHGLVYKDIHRTNRDNPNEPRVIMGCVYNEDNATYLFNNLVPILYGFLNNFRIFFSKNNLEEDKAVCDEKNIVMDWLKLSMLSHAKENRRSETFYTHINRLIDDN